MKVKAQFSKSFLIIAIVLSLWLLEFQFAGTNFGRKPQWAFFRMENFFAKAQSSVVKI